MDLSRRDVLEGLGACAALAATPGPVIAAVAPIDIEAVFGLDRIAAYAAAWDTGSAIEALGGHDLVICVYGLLDRNRRHFTVRPEFREGLMRYLGDHAPVTMVLEPSWTPETLLLLIFDHLGLLPPGTRWRLEEATGTLRIGRGPAEA